MHTTVSFLIHFVFFLFYFYIRHLFRILLSGCSSIALEFASTRQILRFFCISPFGSCFKLGLDNVFASLPSSILRPNFFFFSCQCWLELGAVYILFVFVVLLLHWKLSNGCGVTRVDIYSVQNVNCRYRSFTCWVCNIIQELQFSAKFKFLHAEGLQHLSYCWIKLSCFTIHK